MPILELARGVWRIYEESQKRRATKILLPSKNNSDSDTIDIADEDRQKKKRNARLRRKTQFSRHDLRKALTNERNQKRFRSLYICNLAYQCNRTDEVIVRIRQLYNITPNCRLTEDEKFFTSCKVDLL